MVRRLTDNGRRMHRDVGRDRLRAVPAAAEPRGRSLDLLVVATDVYTWKLLRRDRGLDRTTTEQRMHAPGRAVTQRPKELTMADILFVTWDGGGNVPPAAGHRRELQARGHAVRFLGHAARRAALEAPARGRARQRRPPLRPTRADDSAAGR